MIPRARRFTTESSLTFFCIHPDGSQASGHRPSMSLEFPLLGLYLHDNKIKTGCLTHYRRGKACATLSVLFYQKMVQIYDLHIFPPNPAVAVGDCMVSRCMGKGKVCWAHLNWWGIWMSLMLLWCFTVPSPMWVHLISPLLISWFLTLPPICRVWFCFIVATF